jgi:hypothetical protein
MSYPAKYQPLLAGAGLIRTGKMTLMGYVSEEKRNKLEESSNTWKKSEEPLIDTTDVPIRISVVHDAKA